MKNIFERKLTFHLGRDPFAMKRTGMCGGDGSKGTYTDTHENSRSSQRERKRARRLSKKKKKENDEYHETKVESSSL